MHTWDYGFWLKYLDLQRQALKLKPIFEDLDEQAENRQYQPVVDQIIAFWQTYPVTIYGSQIYLHAMAKTFFQQQN